MDCWHECFLHLLVRKWREWFWWIHVCFSSLVNSLIVVDDIVDEIKLKELQKLYSYSSLMLLISSFGLLRIWEMVRGVCKYRWWRLSLDEFDEIRMRHDLIFSSTWRAVLGEIQTLPRLSSLLTHMRSTFLKDSVTREIAVRSIVSAPKDSSNNYSVQTLCSIKQQQCIVSDWTPSTASTSAPDQRCIFDSTRSQETMPWSLLLLETIASLAINLS